jgi:uncharacterized protein (DUF2126 family)
VTRDDRDRLGAELALHDDLVRRRGVDVWVGAEPTFTRPDSADPPWHYQAEGGDKLERARRLLAALACKLPAGATLHRVVGRHFPEEEAPRFAWGARWSRSAPGAAMPAAPIEPPPLDAPPAPGPPLADDEAWLTVTPDPGVVEVNMAPCPDASSFLDQACAVWDAARAAELASLRFRYNGDVTDSGGGGQITLGGPTPLASPFFRYPHLLPALVRYVNNHPSLSYWFAGDCVGSASQAPRADEGAPERWEELGLALEWLEHLADRGELAPERLWQALAPLLVDASGNSHRAELNVEKLWNPHIAGRGKLGVVEWRAFRMPPHPGMLAAAAALLRALITRLVVAPYREPLVDHRDDLHDAWALPHFLALDLRRVLGDLDQHGVGLPPMLRAELDAWRDPGITCHLGAATLSITRAVEFWPLLGDTASQEQASARLVDASIERWQILVRGADRPWILVGGRRVDLAGTPHDDLDIDGTRVIGVRRRAWVPSPGLHPGLPAQDPLVVAWGHGDEHQRVTLHAWRPLGGAYEGLPVDDGDAATRRAERVSVHTAYDPLPRPAAAHRRSGLYTIDLRRPAPLVDDR